MGFEVRGSTVTLEFGPGSVLGPGVDKDGNPTPAAVVRCSIDMSIRDFVAMQRLARGITEDADVGVIEETYRTFATAALRSWNLLDDGVPLPATADGFAQLPIASANAIFSAWSDAIGGRSPNSPAASANGARSEADFERMVPA